MRRLLFWAVVIAAAVGVIWFLAGGPESSDAGLGEHVRHRIEDAGDALEDLADDAGEKAEEAIHDGKRIIEDLAD